MEPRHLCRGNPRKPPSCGESASSFNGAAASLPRKHLAADWSKGVLNIASMEPRHLCRGNDAARPALGGPVVLQWSRGISAAETRRRRLRVPHAETASMEPRHLCRGNGEATRSDEVGESLQWSRGNYCRS